MASIRHIALTTKDPEKTAAFYMQAFDMQEVSRSPNGSHYSGIHHLGFQIDDMEEATHKLEAAQGQQINQRPGVAAGTRSTTPRNYEVKWSGPDGVVLDVSQSGWLGAP